MNAQLDCRIFEDQMGLVREHEALFRHTTWRVGGPARFFAEPEEVTQTWKLVRQAQRHEVPCYILGGGSNLLVDDGGVPGLVIKMSRLRWRFHVGDKLHVGAGESLPGLVKYAARNGIRGFGRFAGIPGLIGGMLRTNSGGCHGNLSDVLHAVRLLRPDGTVRVREAGDLGLDYRQSDLKQEIALELVFNVECGDPRELEEERARNMDAKIASQPLNQCNAGCVFRNPDGEHAGRLIDECGLKGTRVSNAVVSDEHANFICNEGGASASDVLLLIDIVRDAVREQTGHELDLEVVRWP